MKFVLSLFLVSVAVLAEKEKKTEKRGVYDLGYGGFGHGGDDFGSFGHEHGADGYDESHSVKAITITKEVKVPVPHPYPVHVLKPYPVYVEKKVPYPVKVPVPVTHPVPVPKPYPVEVHVPVVAEKKVPVYIKEHRHEGVLDEHVLGAHEFDAHSRFGDDHFDLGHL